MKENLLVSFSGGETSAYLAKWLIDNKSDIYNMVFVFANTGDEEEETLKFIDICSKKWNINIVWVEAVVHYGERIASTHKVVNFKTASRNREPFKEVIKKYGIPNQNFLHCNREMKLNPIKSYMKSLGWKDYKTAIGIRVDEFDRMNKHRKKLGLIYPFISDKPTTKQEVSYWWSKQDFRLKIKSYNTNCRTCWKKSDKVLAQIYKENPNYFDFNKEMEIKYGKEKYTFFRNGRSTEQLIKDLEKINSKPRDKHSDINFQTNLFFESCDIYSLCGGG
jgi:hypothetical protein